jgi:hypothetical protein
VPLGVIIFAAGAVLLAVGLLRVRGPYTRLQALRATEANLRRYDDWRGKRLSPEPGERTGADEMGDLLRRQVYLWGGTAVAGSVLMLLGVLVRR